MGYGEGIASIGMTSTAARRTVRSQPVVLAAAAVVILALAGIAYGFAKGVGGESSPGQPVVGDAAPFTIKALDGTTFELAAHAEQPVLLYFWASWCVPCRSEAPMIQRLWGEYQAKGYTFVGMNIWDTEADARKFMEDFELTFPLVRDPENKVYLDYGVETLPMAFLIRPGLEIDRRYVGELKESDLRTMLDGLRSPS